LYVRNAKQTFEEFDKHIQKMLIKSLQKKLCSNCLAKKPEKLVIIACILFLLSGVFSIVMYIILIDIVYLLSGIIFLSQFLHIISISKKMS
jgi:hypothetical protein